MTTSRSSESVERLLRTLLALPRETSWIEFKQNNHNPDLILEYVSALANAAALADRPCGYLVWGIEDETHAVVGTSFRPHSEKKGNEDLEPWLHHSVTPSTRLEFLEVVLEGKAVVVLEIERAWRQPVRARDKEFIRIGSQKTALRDHPEKERALWKVFDRTSFEDGIAASDLDGNVVTELLDCGSYFSLTKQREPDSRSGVLDSLLADRLIVEAPGERWSITNLGAILFAKRLDQFSTVSRKAVRVVVYKGIDRVRTEKEQQGGRGYASGFAGLIDYVMALVPANEEIKKALRESRPMYPTLAVRELVANALIHQDFSVTGAGPMVELFADRIEITNPGQPLIEVDRFLDKPPRSRNETLAALMRRMGICEERGSGIDKAVFEIEFNQLPAPLFEVLGENTRIVLFAHQPLSKMSRVDRVRACYLHACLKYVSRGHLTNSSLRERFGIEEKNSATASRLIKEAVDAGRIVPERDDSSRKLMRYLPHWATLPPNKT